MAANTNITPVTVRNADGESTRFYGYGNDSALTKFIEGCGFVSGATSVYGLVVDLNECTVTARVFQLGADGQRIVNSGGYPTEEATRSLVGTLPDAEYVINEIGALHDKVHDILDQRLYNDAGLDVYDNDDVDLHAIAAEIVAAAYKPKES